MIRISILCAVLVLALGAPGLASAQHRPWTGTSVFEDAEWRKHFLGSYGFLSGVEPEVSAEERLMLPEVLQLLEADPQAARALLEERVAGGSSAALDFLLANLHFQNGETESASRLYVSALEKFPDFRRAHKNLGLLYIQSSDFPRALEHLTRAVELGDRDGRNYGLIGHGYINLENYLAAEIAYRNAVLQQPNVRDWKLGLARSLLALERYEDAVGLFDTLLREDPEDATAWMLQANAYIGSEKPLAAAVNIEAVRMLGQAQSSSLVLLGDIYMNERMPKLAKSAYLEVIEKDEAGTEFRTAQRAADLLIRARSHDAAQEILRKIEARYAGLTNDEQLDVLTLKARVARGQGREAEAAKLLDSIARRDGTRGDALLELAAYHQGGGDHDRALLYVERAERLEEYEYPALLRHAQILVARRDYPGAVKVLRRALQIKSEPRVERFLASVERAIPSEQTL
jgi:tetratricopeptide (TPR) repeat protein